MPEENKENEAVAPLPEAPAPEPEDEEIDGSDITEDAYVPDEVKPRHAILSDVFDFLEMLLIAACAILFLFTFVARLSTVEGSSMFRTLEDGDKLVVSDLFYTPQSGDIIVFQDLSSGHKTAIVKRVIAVGGQHVRLDYHGGTSGATEVTVTVDGEVLDEPYRYYDDKRGNPYRYVGTYEYDVPDGCLFVMGDNTHNSEDSRGDFHYVSEDKVLGRVVFRLCGADLSGLFSKIGPVS